MENTATLSGLLIFSIILCTIQILGLLVILLLHFLHNNSRFSLFLNVFLGICGIAALFNGLAHPGMMYFQVAGLAGICVILSVMLSFCKMMPQKDQ